MKKVVKWQKHYFYILALITDLVKCLNQEIRAKIEEN